MSKVVVIGGGASGIVAAIQASKNNEVTILERNSECAKKILMTGNGKCNYFNSDIDINNYYTDNYDKLKIILNEENIKRVMDFFDSIGVIPRIKNGYFYPYSNQATTIKSMLLSAVKNNNIAIMNDIEVKNVIKKDDIFIINQDKENIKADKIILATGSIAGLKNIKNIGLEIAKSFHFKVIEPLPALVQLHTNNPLKMASGVRVDAKISLYVDNNLEKEESGELQLTDYGISGICTLNISNIVSQSLKLNKKVLIKINFLPTMNKDSFISWLDERESKLSNLNIVQLLESIVNYKLMYAILKEAKINKDSKWIDLNKKAKDSIKELLFNYPLVVNGTSSFDKAQVATGGVSLNCINPTTMESNIKNLYITGEILNVDGKCGGFNLGFAWITGLIAGELK